jgi:hypothetical protein
MSNEMFVTGQAAMNLQRGRSRSVWSSLFTPVLGIRHPRPAATPAASVALVSVIHHGMNPLQPLWLALSWQQHLTFFHSHLHAGSTMLITHARAVPGCSNQKQPQREAISHDHLEAKCCRVSAEGS